MAGLTRKQQRFVVEYLTDLNATQAAIRSGYAPKNADVTGPRLLGNVGVAQAIASATQAHESAIEITQDYVLSNVKEILERCMQRAPVMVKVGKDWVQETDNDGKNVWTFDAMGAVKAVTLLGKHRGMFSDKLQIDDLREVSKLSDEEIAERRRQMKLA